MAEAGIVGMGGATFPAAVKLNLRAKYDLHTLIINAAECEPYLTCDDRLMRERAEEIADGAGIMARALGVDRIIVAIESNKPQAIEAMALHKHALGYALQIKVVPTQYPMGSEKHLVKTLTGKETPVRALTAELGLVVHNAATAHAVHLACRYGEPSISRAVIGRLIETPRGTLPLRTFFVRAFTPGSGEEGPSQDAVISLVGDIVRREDAARPLSDAAIANLAKGVGIALARRTVAKYRDLLGIPCSYERRQRAVAH